MSNDIASLPPVGPTPPFGAPSFGTPPAKRDGAKPADALGAPDPAPDKTAAKDERGFFDRLWGKDGFSFGALLDIVNPLQHIPIVGTVYRAITGDSIGPAARIAGGTLFGGVIGLVASSINSLVEEETGRDFGQHILAMRNDADKPADPTTPTGRPERDAVLYAGDFSPRPEGATMLAEAAPKPAPKSAVVAAADMTATPAAPQIAAAPFPPTQPRAAVANARVMPVAAPVVHEAANGAGGKAVPLTTTVNRRIASPLPTPQTLAGDPALLRQMQTARPQNQPRNVPGINTTIRPPAAAAGVSPTFLDYTPKNAALRSAPSDAPADKTEPAPQAQKIDLPPVQKIDPGSFPQVPADLITRMNVALEKYQAMQHVTDRPAVNFAQ